MKVFEMLKMSIRSLKQNKMRSFLTMLGVIIGVASVIILVAIAQGSTKKAIDSIKSLGSNMIRIDIYGRKSNRAVTLEELNDISEEADGKISKIAPIVQANFIVKYANRNLEVPIEGTSPEYEEIRSFHVQWGRFISDLDVSDHNKVALIGVDTASELFGDFDPVGQEIKINGIPFEVIGMLEKKGSSMLGSNDNKIILPYTVAQRLVKNSVINNYMLQAYDADSVQYVVDLINTFLTTKYKDPKTFKVFNQAEMLQMQSENTEFLTKMLGGIAAISLIVGGIGIMNIMLVSVTERTKEIGIRKALGARRKNILSQFLVEAAAISGLGGLLGVILGLGGISSLSKFSPGLPTQASLQIVLIAFSFSLIVGVVFGLYPANQASKLNPIDALRSE